MDASHLRFESVFFDLVICGYVLGHLGNHGADVLKEIHRVLKPAGRLIVIDNVRDLNYFLLSTPHFFFLSYLRGGKARRLTENYWNRSVVEAGFALRKSTTGKGIIVLEGQRD